MDLQEILQPLREAGVSILEVRISEEGQEQSIELRARTSKGASPGELAARIAQVEKVRNVDWTR